MKALKHTLGFLFFLLACPVCLIAMSFIYAVCFDDMEDSYWSLVISSVAFLFDNLVINI